VTEHGWWQERLGKKLLYGSDWIMFDREANYGNFFRDIAEQFHRAQFAPAMVDDFAHGNARRSCN
jgi:hypothetical protein